MRLVKKLAVCTLVRSWSGIKMKKMSNEQVNRRNLTSALVKLLQWNAEIYQACTGLLL